MVITMIILILLACIDSYDSHLWSRGRYKYSVLIGIKGDDDSIEDYRIYANRPSEAECKARIAYCQDNSVAFWDINVYAVERI